MKGNNKFKKDANERTNRSRKTNSRGRGPKSKKLEYDQEAPLNQKGPNDPTWYAKNPQLLKDVASLAYVWPAGVPFRYGDSLSFVNDRGKRVNRGVCSMLLAPTLNWTDNASAAINSAGVKLLSFLKHTVSSKLPYESPELISMLYAMANVYAYINFLRRAYGCCWFQLNENRYTPDALLTSMGIDPSVRGDLAKFRSVINTLTVRAAALAVPANVTIFYRTAFLYANVYTAGSSVKDQLYMYNPAGFYVYNETDPEIPGAHLELDLFRNLTGDDMGSYADLKNLDELLSYGLAMLQPLLASEDIGVISANILRAYGDGGILKLSLIEDNFAIQPIFDIGVLEQMANAEVLSPQVALKLFSNGSTTIKQVVDENNVALYLEYKPTLTDDNLMKLDKASLSKVAARSSMNHILTTTTAFTDVTVNVESTRLKYSVNYQSGGKRETIEFHFATEVCVGVDYVGVGIGDPAGNPLKFVRQDEFLSLVDGEPMDTTNAYINLLAANACFRFHPQFNYLYAYAKGSTTSTVFTFNSIDPFYDIDNFTVIDDDELNAMNEVITYSLFDAPGVAQAY